MTNQPTMEQLEQFQEKANRMIGDLSSKIANVEVVNSSLKIELESANGYITHLEEQLSKLSQPCEAISEKSAE